MKKITHLVALLGLSSACGVPAETTPSAVTPTAHGLEATNALVFNALDPAAIDLRPLGANPLEALPANAQAMLGDAGMTGSLAREFLKYAVSCALDDGSGYELTWVDILNQTHVEWYPGDLGLAPGWRQNALSVQGQEWVSACVYARVNWYGAVVEISLRGGNGGLALSAGEETSFAVEEGTFWGNVFADRPVAYSCNIPGSMAYARAQLRDCAAGHVNLDTSIVPCGIIRILGACQDTCTASAEAPSVKQCSDGAGQTYDTTITTFLQ